MTNKLISFFSAELSASSADLRVTNNSKFIIRYSTAFCLSPIAYCLLPKASQHPYHKSIRLLRHVTDRGDWPERAEMPVKDSPWQ